MAPTSVGRSVGNRDDLEIETRLLENGHDVADVVPETVARVVVRHDDRELGNHIGLGDPIDLGHRTSMEPGTHHSDRVPGRISAIGT